MKIIKFNAIWCPACLVMKSVWKKIEEEFSDLDITNYDYDMNKEEVLLYNVGNILPVTIILSDDKKELERLIGEVSYNKLKEVISSYRK